MSGNLKITAFGRHWKFRKRESETGQLLGLRQASSHLVNMAEQSGVYILYDRGRPVYVGKTERGGLIHRLREHRKGKKWERWDTFSWYGIIPVNRETGKLEGFDYERNQIDVIDVLESVLIEVLEPHLNNKSGSSIGEMYVQRQEKIKKI